MSRLTRALCAASAVALVLSETAFAQSQLPPIVVQTAPKTAKRMSATPRTTRPAAGEARATRHVASRPPVSSVPSAGGSLTVPTTAQAITDIQRTPGGVEVVPDTVFKNGPANTVKDVLGSVPGVITQMRYGPDARLSIRGSGLSRNYGNRGINPYMDGIPINTSDGLFDLFEVDPTTYRYVEVYKGANALRYGANSLGGAINFVMPTGRDASPFEARFDAGSFGYVKSQFSTGGANGPYDWFVTGSAQHEDGYREHSSSHVERLNANVGYRFSLDAETRFYVNASSWRARIPGELTKDMALNSPRSANPIWVQQDQQRNIDSIRLANKTTLHFEDTTVDFGIFGLERHVMHPIYQWLDFRVHDYGGFVRATDERLIGGFRNRLVAGVNLQNGTIDINYFANPANAMKGQLTASYLWTSENIPLYAENSFYVLPGVALVTGGQFLHAVRSQHDRFLADGDQSGSRTWDIFSPKVGLLWDADPKWQVFGNVSRNAEVPTFDVNTYQAPANPDVNAQTGITYEIGTRGRTPDLTWDLSLYRTNLSNEFQCLTTAPWSPCTVVNADRTVHQGVEAALGVALLRSTAARDDQIWFNVAYTYGDFRFHHDATWGNNRLPGAPPHYVRAELLYKRPDGFYVGPNVEWMPHTFFADNANSLTVDPYALLNFKLGVDEGKSWSWYVEARNLFDTRYISTTITAGKANPTMELFNPGTGRAVYGGVRYRM
jgi:iron complex outermembrane receptor protein